MPAPPVTARPHRDDPPLDPNLGVPPPVDLGVAGIHELAVQWWMRRQRIYDARHRGRFPEPCAVVGAVDRSTSGGQRVSQGIGLWRPARLGDWRPGDPLDQVPPPSWGGGLPPVVALRDIADLFDVAWRDGDGTPSIWRRRGQMPTPDAIVSGTPIWLLSRIQAWAAHHKAPLFLFGRGAAARLAALPPHLQAVVTAQRGS